jgi:hypothetical protein
MHVALAASLLVLIQLSCSGAGPPGGGPRAAVSAGPRVLLDGPVTCLGRPRAEHVFREAAAFATWWNATTCGRRKVPAVDFAKEMVLAVEDADASNGCHDVRVLRAEAGAEGLSVFVERRVPGPTELCTQQVVRPVSAVAVPRSEGEVVFIWQVVTGP